MRRYTITSTIPPRPPRPPRSRGRIAVPMLIISPYAKEGKKHHGYISHTQYEFGSILKFIENVWGLGQLGTTDTRATSIVDSFDFTQSAYFLHQKPSYRPVDSE